MLWTDKYVFIRILGLCNNTHSALILRLTLHIPNVKKPNDLSAVVIKWTNFLRFPFGRTPAKEQNKPAASRSFWIKRLYKVQQLSGNATSLPILSNSYVTMLHCQTAHSHWFCESFSLSHSPCRQQLDGSTYETFMDENLALPMYNMLAQCFRNTMLFTYNIHWQCIGTGACHN